MVLVQSPVEKMNDFHCLRFGNNAKHGDAFVHITDNLSKSRNHKRNVLTLRSLRPLPLTCETYVNKKIENYEIVHW